MVTKFTPFRFFKVVVSISQGPQAALAHISAQPPHTCLGTRLPVNDKNIAASAKKRKVDRYKTFIFSPKQPSKYRKCHFRDPKFKNFTGSGEAPDPHTMVSSHTGPLQKSFGQPWYRESICRDVYTHNMDPILTKTTPDKDTIYRLECRNVLSKTVNI